MRTRGLVLVISSVVLLGGAIRLIQACGGFAIVSPTEGNKYTYNTATPGTKALTCAANEEDSGITWSCENVSGTQISWQPDPPKGRVVTLTFTGLPSSNSSFGDTWVKAVLGGESDTNTFKLFFIGTDAATNHPDPGAGVTPNWFYYWQQTTANYGTPYYDEDSALGYTIYEGGSWKAYLGYSDNNPYTPPDGDNKGNELTGIDHFAWACRHEARHVTTASIWYPSGDDDAGDSDDDNLPDALEPSLGGTQQNPINGGPFTVPVKDTDGDGLQDEEDYTCHTQAAWTEGAADSEDWSKYGHQW